MSYNDEFADYWGSLASRLEKARQVSKSSGTLHLHLGYQEVYYAKVLLDALFRYERLLNKIVWIYDYGARARHRWPAEHDSTLVYVKDPKQYYSDSESVGREPYMALGLATMEKAARGKPPTGVRWHAIASPTGKEKTGYAVQRPGGTLRQIMAVSSRPGGQALDFFAGSGTTGAVAGRMGHHFVLIDENP